MPQLSPSKRPDRADLDLGIDRAHRVAELEIPVVRVVALDVLGAVARPDVLPPELGTVRPGRRSGAVDLVADLPQLDPAGSAMATGGPQARPLADRLPVAPFAVDADRPVVVDITVEERDRRRGLLGGAAERRRPRLRGARSPA